MLAGELDLYIGVSGTNGGRGAVGLKIDATVRNADIVDDRGQIIRREIWRRISSSMRSTNGRRFLDARAGGRTQMELELAAIDAGEKILPHQRQEREGKNAGREEADDECLRCRMAASSVPR